VETGEKVAAEAAASRFRLIFRYIGTAPSRLARVPATVDASLGIAWEEIMVEATTPLVGIVMGSDSDWPKIKAAATALEEFGVPYEVHVMSAHRTPEVVHQYATMAAARGLQVVIAAAGGAAHLAGVVASHTTLPVIGLPVATDFSGGLDSLLSVVQMPGDVPVATVGVGGGGPRNAGLLAVQILALGDPNLQEKLAAFKRKLAEKITEKDAALQKKIKAGE
jgi:5-(carboxyamino)imidazole ribonucleotide mutase